MNLKFQSGLFVASFSLPFFLFLLFICKAVDEFCLGMTQDLPLSQVRLITLSLASL